MTFQQKLDLLVKKQNSLLCVGLDADIEKILAKYKNFQNPQFEFNKYIIDQTYNVVCSYKPNSAFYEAHGPEGLQELKMTCDYIRARHPEIPIILDFKRGDIENTNEGYAQFAFDYLHVDAVTVQPYLGKEALDPFLKQKNKGIFVLCKTSNRGSEEFQNLIVDGKPLYKKVASQVADAWNKNKNCYLVVGATHPNELAEVRALVGDMVILTPGIGTQGGTVAEIVPVGVNSEKKGLIVNASRAVIFADNPREEATRLRDEINKYRN